LTAIPTTKIPGAYRMKAKAVRPHPTPEEGATQMNDVMVTVSGNLVDAPELRYTQAGQAVASFRVASTPRYHDQASGQWKDGNTLFLSCTAWRQLAENAAESLPKGTRVIVTGRLQQRSYETSDGSKRTVFEITADDIAPSLRTATVTIARTSRSGATAAGAVADEWSTRPASDEPPF
jgi:single-strand DNA-binding protein